MSAGLAGWTPIRVFGRDGHPWVDWCRLGGGRFVDPFFEQTITHALRNPARLLFRKQTPAEVLEDAEWARLGIPPSGFVFHLSRCGSTLVAQMLAAVPENVVVSEAPPLDRILMLHHALPGLTRERRISWVRGMINALGQRRAGDEHRYFIKFDSWHVLELSLISEAFPGVPWIFLYRDPTEVMVSQNRLPGTQTIPGMVDPRVFGLEPGALARLTPTEYCATVLARHCEAAVTAMSAPNGRLVNFSELPDVVWRRGGNLFGIDWNEHDVRRMREATRANAKTPALPHVDDRDAKQREATDEIRRAVASWLAEPYARLEALRLQRGAQGVVRQ